MTAEFSDTIVGWLSDLENRNESAAAEVWQRYFARLVRLARHHLRHSETRVEDEEDVALSVLHSFVDGAAEQRFESIEGHHDLWILLATMTHRKCVNRIRRNVAAKRGGGRVAGENDLAGRTEDSAAAFSLDQLESVNPTPESLAVMQEEYEQLLSRLRTDGLRQIAGWRLDGYSTAEIAERAGLSERSVRRKLELIRETWLDAARESPQPSS